VENDILETLKQMIYRVAIPADIAQIQVVRHTVKENTLSDPALVPDADVFDFITRRGRGWVCESDGQILGFAIVDLIEHNIWALFLRPECERLGIGERLQTMMLDWYFEQTQETVWLGTAPGTRAEGFYQHTGWTRAGMHGQREVKFEMRYTDWRARRAQ
jgi:GNAT superfamily N-acetyltransferase